MRTFALLLAAAALSVALPAVAEEPAPAADGGGVPFSSEPVSVKLTLPSDWAVLSPVDLPFLLMVAGKNEMTGVTIVHLKDEGLTATQQAEATCAVTAAGQKTDKVITVDPNRAFCNILEDNGTRARVTVLHFGTNGEVQLGILSEWSPTRTADGKESLRLIDTIRAERLKK